jgi:hypothetical protein
MLRKLIVILFILGVLYGMYKFGTRNASVTLTESLQVENPVAHQAVTFQIDGQPITLEDGEASIEADGEVVSTVRYFGNELRHDVDGDGTEDVVFLVTTDASGSGTFYYVVAALKRGDSYVGTEAYFLGDRIAPQTISRGEANEVLVTYAERAPGEPMTSSPSVGVSVYLELEAERLQFKEIIKEDEFEQMPVESI